MTDSFQREFWFNLYLEGSSWHGLTHCNTSTGLYPRQWFSSDGWHQHRTGTRYGPRSSRLSSSTSPLLRVLHSPVHAPPANMWEPGISKTHWEKTAMPLWAVIIPQECVRKRLFSLMAHANLFSEASSVNPFNEI